MKRQENSKVMKGLSQREVEIIAWLEFYKKYFFSSKDIKHFFKGKNTLYKGIQKLLSKRRIIKLIKISIILFQLKLKVAPGVNILLLLLMRYAIVKIITLMAGHLQITGT